MAGDYENVTEYITAEEPELLERRGNERIKTWKNNKSRLVSALLRKRENERIVTTPAEVPSLVDDDVDVVVHMGCHVVQTPHIVDATVDVLEALEYSIVPLGGFNNCCGSLDYRQGTFEDGERVDDARFNNVETFDPEYFITECTSCFANTERFSSKYRDLDGFEFSSMIEFLHRRRDRFDDLIDVTEPVTVAFHDHYDPGRWTPTRQGELAREFFESFPGVDVVEMEHSLETSLPCNFLSNPDDYGYQDLTARVLEEATAAGADVLVDFWHACHRHMVAYDDQYPVETTNYATFLAERLGFSYRDKTREYKQAAMDGDVEWVIEDSRPVFESNGLTEEDAREIVTEHLTPQSEF